VPSIAEELGLRELMLGELAAIAGQHHARDAHRVTRERDQANLGHRSSLLSFEDDHAPDMSSPPIDRRLTQYRTLLAEDPTPWGAHQVHLWRDS
jgi:hypothetical protein